MAQGAMSWSSGASSVWMPLLPENRTIRVGIAPRMSDLLSEIRNRPRLVDGGQARSGTSRPAAAAEGTDSVADGHGR